MLCNTYIYIEEVESVIVHHLIPEYLEYLALALKLTLELSGMKTMTTCTDEDVHWTRQSQRILTVIQHK